MVRKMENNNSTVKVVSWNVNAFCKTERWNAFKNEERKNGNWIVILMF